MLSLTAYLLMPKQTTENSSDEEINDIEDTEQCTETDTKKKKVNVHELYTELLSRFNSFEELETTFMEKEKEYEKEQKEYYSSHKKTMREITNIMKKFEKLLNDISKKSKPRKNENSGKGGFNKQTDVPVLLREYIGIDKDELKSRPEVTKLLNEKFKEAGLMKIKKDENDKEIKMIVLDKFTAKKLKRENGTEFRSKDIQTFIAHFYHDEAKTLSA